MMVEKVVGGDGGRVWGREGGFGCGVVGGEGVLVGVGDMGRLERQVIRVGLDESLSIEERLSLMQRMMFARWEMIGEGSEKSDDDDKDGRMHEANYIVLKDGRKFSSYTLRGCLSMMGRASAVESNFYWPPLVLEKMAN